MRVEIVVARYKENIEWTKGLPVVVYNKYHPEPVELPNIGREAHTFLTHIVRNYDNLPDGLIFVQADPFPHCNKLQEVVNNLQWTGYEPLGHWMAKDSPYGVPNAGFPLEPWWLLVTQSHLHMTCPKEFIFPAGACMAVTREAIRQHSKEFYEHVLTFAENEKFAYAMERFWPYIFTIQELPSSSTEPKDSSTTLRTVIQS